MKLPMLRLGAVTALVAVAAVSGGNGFATRKEQTMGTQSAKLQDGKPFRIFNPETMAKPTAGYSQVAEVGEGKIVYIAGQIALDKSGNLVGKDDFRVQVQRLVRPEWLVEVDAVAVVKK